MTPEQYHKIKDIFLAASDKPRDQQLAYVAEVCDGDEAIRREVESLLEEHHREQNPIPAEPKSPMSGLLSRAGINITNIEAGQLLSNPGQSRAGGPLIEQSDSGSRSGFVDPGRFMAGTVVANRYRIIELLGRGGMGEVYRADDIKLGQTVALKFLPKVFSQDTKWLERFHNEVRIARQVSHPNVCRVFDIGEYEGEQFISMEYIDGENLTSLLRRIGRVPHDKAIQIAKQLCAGLAAAHDKGVLHRDLKPANVMIDGRGQVRITDFGLAAPVDQLRKENLRAGTPAYMSPEQLLGKAVTVRSDVYSVGLIFYEMFTGRQPFKGDSLRDYIKHHTESIPDPPSDIVPDIDPEVERTIQRCMEKDPRNRPSSILAVAAALPGGNLLQEILATGETPSPEIVAAAGGITQGLRPLVAASLLVAALLNLILAVFLAPHAFIIQKAIREKAPAVLMDKARDVTKEFGYTTKPRDALGGFGLSAQYYVYTQETQTGPDRWKLLTRPRPGLVYYWYRQGPDLLVPIGAASVTQPVTLELDPPLDRPGMINLRLDPLARLIYFQAEPELAPGKSAAVTASNSTTLVAPVMDTSAESATAIDWTLLFRAAGVDEEEQKRFHPVNPERIPPIFADTRMAWKGSFKETPGEPVQLEAAAYRGKIVYFAVIGPWDRPQVSTERDTILSIGQANLVVQTTVTILLLLAGSYLAFRNHQSGRGDRVGATRMGIAFLILGILTWILRTHHVPHLLFEFSLFTNAMGDVLYMVALVWVFYLALEPFVRRVWPETIISWSRLISGKWSDPLVGRDVLIGALVGLVTLVLTQMEHLIPRWLGNPAPMPNFSVSDTILQSATNYSSLFSGAITSMYFGLILLLFIVLLRIISRRKWVACTVFVVVFVAASARWNVTHWVPESAISWGIQAAIGLMYLMLLTRYGLISIIACLLCRIILWNFPITPDFNLWYGNSAIVAIVSTLALLGVSFYTSLGGRRLFNLQLLDA